MRLRVGVSPGLVLSVRRLSSSPSNIPLSLPVLSLGPQLKNEWELWWLGRADIRDRMQYKLHNLNNQTFLISATDPKSLAILTLSPLEKVITKYCKALPSQYLVTHSLNIN